MRVTTRACIYIYIYPIHFNLEAKKKEKIRINEKSNVPVPHRHRGESEEKTPARQLAVVETSRTPGLAGRGPPARQSPLRAAVFEVFTRLAVADLPRHHLLLVPRPRRVSETWIQQVVRVLYDLG